MINEPDWNLLWSEKKDDYNILQTKHLVALDAIKYLESIEEIKTICDFGCGYGSVLRELSSENKYILNGYDDSDYFKSDLEKKGIKFIKKNLMDLIEEKPSCDVAILTDVLEHFFQPKKLLEAFVNCKYVIVVVPNFSDIFGRLQVLKGNVPTQMKPKRGGHVYWFNLDSFYDVVKDRYSIVKEMHSFPSKIEKLKFLKNYPNLFAHQFCAILKGKL